MLQMNWKFFSVRVHYLKILITYFLVLLKISFQTKFNIMKVRDIRIIPPNIVLIPSYISSWMEIQPITKLHTKFLYREVGWLIKSKQIALNIAMFVTFLVVTIWNRNTENT
jgi:hypothetical protein